MHGDLQWLPPNAGVEDSRLRRDRDPCQQGIGGARSRRAGLNPAEERLVFRRLRVQPFAPAVGNSRGRLEQEQTLSRACWEESPAARLLNDGLVIVLGLVAEEGQFEAVLPRCLTMATAGVTAELR